MSLSVFDATNPSGYSHSRRKYLKTTGAALAGLAFASTASADTSQYETTVDIVEAGADPTGEEPIDDVLADYNRDGTLIEFPDGRYKINKLSLYKRENFAMVGTGDATLVPGDDYDRDLWIGGGFVRDLRFEGFVLDHSAENTDPQVAFGGFDNVVVRDITKRGYHDGGTTAFGFSTWDEDGHMLVENLQMADGSIPQNPVGIYVNTTGTVTFRDCHVEGFGNNGLYASSSDGPVQVEGGVYKNSDIAQIRLGSPGSYVKDATVVVDDDHMDHDNSRGIRIADGHGPVDIEGCEIVMKSGQGGGGVVGAMSGGNFNLSNSRIYVSKDYTSVGSNGTRGAGAILVDEPTEISDPGTNTIENVAITGDAEYRSAICLRRDNNVIKDVCIHQTGYSRDGVTAERGSSNNRVENTNINVPDKEIYDKDGDISVSGLTLDDACAYPSGVDQTETTSTDEISLADAPWPSNSSRLTYATMGHDDTVTAEIFMGFEDFEDEEAAQLVMPHLLEEFVQAGELNVRFRPYGFESERGEFLAGLLQGVWNYEWERFWEFFGWAYENKDAYDLDSYESGRDFLKAFGIRNSGKITVQALENYYADSRAESADVAAEHGIPEEIPCILLDGDMTWVDRDDPHERDDLDAWIRDRL